MQPLRRRSQFASEPTRDLKRFHRINRLDDELMDLIANRTFECPDVKARGPGGDACQHQVCLAVGAARSMNDHDTRLGSGESANTPSHRVTTEGPVMVLTMSPEATCGWSILLIHENFIHRPTRNNRQARGFNAHFVSMNFTAPTGSSAPGPLSYRLWSCVRSPPTRTVSSRRGKCIICEGTAKLAGHEVWKCDEKKTVGTATLLKVDAVCRTCHNIGHCS
jgi:hypothetical protein